ncbi:DUF1120 domain-containing protein [Pseudomonas laurylsulfatiphila]|jgi:type 1 fimbria pilin|uniref:DUF1120 domain-containing protein n=1 Tax=Pseudomonas laurylsulfatiphila TaxID=2011015 RepID=UPI00216023BC|nr:DUF1120 domain-containing protein [Pseudomonas laurylsulfatiphila]UVM04150.1 DUF1120 domain-containing protein [Pseudomonas laurylsulfatiphila]
MKKYLAALATTAAISTTPQAFAVGDTLEVKGIITPVACTPTFSNGGLIDIGKISSSKLKEDENTKVGDAHPMRLTIACDGEISFALKPTDNTGNSSPVGPVAFGLGLTPKNEKLGFFVPSVTKVTADAAEVEAIESTDEVSWVKATAAKPGYFLSFTTTGGSLPIDAKDVTYDFTVDTFIARADSLDLTDEITFEGSATFDVVYY